jgi:hypothetical protein
MSPADKTPDTNRDKLKADKQDRLNEALRENLKRRKSLQRGRGEAAPDAIKNKNRLFD